MNTAKIFPNGRSQAVRLPKEFQFSSDEVYVNRIGPVVVLFPRDEGWDVLAQSLDQFTEDFMLKRDQDEKSEKRTPL
jgi:antitoxin VapB